MTSASEFACFTGLIALFGLALAVLPVRTAAAEVGEIDLIAISGGLYVMGHPGLERNAS